MGQRTKTFDIPGNSGDFDDDVIVCRMDNAAGRPDSIIELQVQINGSVPATATAEVEILKVNGDPEDDDDWMSHTSMTATGVQDVIAFSGACVRIRGKSGGTSGTLEVHAYWI